MPEVDPYATLGVPRAATRTEVAKAYRQLAKQWHPDAGATPEEEASRAELMARLNHAWHVLSNPARRARWDATHPEGGRAHWSAGQAATFATAAGTWSPPVAQRPFRAPAAPASVRDSGWLALGVAAAIGTVIAIAVLVLSMGAQDAGPPWGEGTETFSNAGLSFGHPARWTAFAGRDDPFESHAVIAHVVSFSDVDATNVCTSFSDPCDLSAAEVPPGEWSAVITGWRGGQPPVSDLVRPLPYGLHARFVGEHATAFRLDRTDGGAAGWWQVAAPDFPQRWFEVHAAIGGGGVEQDEAVAEIEAMISTFEFGD